ncbi:MAG: F0F1 ATP synthase subunit epsilon [Thermodesulfobacteriota bacterium]|nr:MAG: F0F1 ATP synthase subunit epsilon [Thermodesulfobacteriota bacterium]
MAGKFLLEIISPTRKLLSEEVEEMTAQADMGEFGILPEHAHYFTLVTAGRVTYKTAKGATTIAVSKGYAEVGPDKTTLLVDGAVSADEIDVDAVREELTAAEEKLRTLEPDDPAYSATEDAIEYAVARLSLKEG